MFWKWSQAGGACVKGLSTLAPAQTRFLLPPCFFWRPLSHCFTARALPGLPVSSYLLAHVLRVWPVWGTRVWEAWSGVYPAVSWGDTRRHLFQNLLEATQWASCPSLISTNLSLAGRLQCLGTRPESGWACGEGFSCSWAGPHISPFHRAPLVS